MFSVAPVSPKTVVARHISRRLNKPPAAEPLPPEPPVLEEEGMIKVPKKDLKRAQGILKDILAGRKVHVTGATREEVPFKVPEVQAGDTNCELCWQSFKSTRSLCCHMKTHTGDTGWSCDQCGTMLASRAMSELHQKSCGQEKGHWCQVCKKDYTTKQALVAHLKVKHGPAPTVEQLTCPTCSKVFKTMREHMAFHKDPFFCRVEGCTILIAKMPQQAHGGEALLLCKERVIIHLILWTKQHGHLTVSLII